MAITVQRIKEIIESQGLNWSEKTSSIYTTCPLCGQDDKLAVSKKGGATICYRGKCNFGRQWFDDWLALTAGISKAEAHSRIKGFTEPFRNDESELSFADVPFELALAQPEISWPPDCCFSLSFDECSKGLAYLVSRGITADLAARYGITYNLATERVVFPITMDGRCVGWQARSVNQVSDKERMRNNPGFNRAASVMFYDRLKNSPHAVICEGPFDAMKFDNVGGNISTMGMAVTSQQVAAILSSGVKKVYLALDDDAISVMQSLMWQMGVELYKPEVPDTCRARCEASGKKADFGECTFEECEKAFWSAKKLGRYDLL